MANYSQLKAAINAAITANGANEITGTILNQVLTSVVNSLGANYHCAGVATPSTNPNSPDQNVFYFAVEEGTYVNFGGIVLPLGISVLMWNGSWSYQTWFEVDNEVTVGSDNFISSNAVAKSFSNVGYRTYEAIGAGNTGVSVEFYAVKGNEYVIALPEIWDYSEVTYDGNLFTIGYKDTNNVSHDIVQVSVNNPSTLKNRYTVNFNEDFISCYVFFRGNAGSKFKFTISESGFENILNSNITFIPTNINRDVLLPNINTSTKTLDLGSDPILMIGNTKYAFIDIFPNNSEYYREIPIYEDGKASGAIKLVFNTDTCRIYAKVVDSLLDISKEIVIGGFRLLYSAHDFIGATLPFEYTINGEFSQINEAVSKKVGISFVPTFNNSLVLPNINTTTKTLDLGADSVLFIGNNRYGFAEIFPGNPEYYRAIPIYDVDNTSGAIKLLLNVSTGRIYAKYYGYTMTNEEIVIGAFRLVYGTHRFIAANLPFKYTIDGNTITEEDMTNILNRTIEEKKMYYGEKPKLNNLFNIGSLFTLLNYGSYASSIDSQGMDVYNDTYLFQGNSPSDTTQNNICVVDLVNKTILGGVAYHENSHVNNINCGTKYAESDTYPVLYISRCYYGKSCDVIRIANDLSGYTLLQTIQYTGTSYMQETTAADWAIADDYIYHYTTNNTTGVTTILKFNMPALTDGATITFTDSDILDVFTFNDSYVYQGGKVINGQLYIAFGHGTEQYPAYIKVFDLTSEQVVTTIPLDGIGESEAVAYYDKGLLVVNNSTNPTYSRLIF